MKTEAQRQMITTETTFDVEVLVRIRANNDDMTVVRKSEVEHSGFSLQQAYEVAKDIETAAHNLTTTRFQGNVKRVEAQQTSPSPTPGA